MMSGIEVDNINSEWIGVSARCPCMHLVCTYNICISVCWYVCTLIRQYVSVLLQIQEAKASRMTWTSKKLAGD